jgi:hypothetical protein
MIGYLIILIGLGLLQGLLSPLLLFSNASLDSNILASISAAGSYLSIVDMIIPVSSLLAVIGIILSIELAITGYKVIRWTYQKLPFIK